ncbi:MAG: sulfotransferase [Dongiaceae bacterium]
MSEKQNITRTEMGVAVMGLMRTGTTLVADLLTNRGKSLVLSEPDLLSKYDPTLAARMRQLAKDFGLPAPTATLEAGNYTRNIDHFDASFMAELKQLDFWGVKYVNMVGWRRLFEIYRPRKIVLCVRDLRAVTVSALELVNRMRLVFADNKHRRDEAWVFSRICYSVHELMALRTLPHLVVRYEDLVGNPATLERLREHVGLETLGTERLNLMIERASRSQWELTKHGKAGEISDKALDRFAREPEGPIRQMAERIWRMMGEYNVAFGYDVPPPAQRIRRHDFASRVMPNDNPINYVDTETWNWRGPTQLEPVFGRRRARILVSRNIGKHAKILDLGSGSTALRRLLPNELPIVLSDNAARSPEFIVSDIYRGNLPPAENATLVTAIGVLEYVDDVRRFLKQLRAYNLPILLTYYPTDDNEDIDRDSYGWRNALSRNELMRAFLAAGFIANPRWAFDGRQSAFRLRPKPVAARPTRKPRGKRIAGRGNKPVMPRRKILEPV